MGDADIKKAALEAILGASATCCSVCAFAFEASVHEQTAELTKEIKLGKLAVLPARMNPDLAMGDELLKKTGAGNLFMVFGEPDVELTTRRRQATVELRGLDVYDPTTGESAARPPTTSPAGSSTPTTTGRASSSATPTSPAADDPYESCSGAEGRDRRGRLVQPLQHVSRPFDPPTGKIAVKVINHYGDEVLKVFRAQ